MLDAQNKTELQEVGEQVGRAIKSETNQFTGSVRFNFKQGRLVNGNVEDSWWPIRKGRRLTGRGVEDNVVNPRLVGDEEPLA